MPAFHWLSRTAVFIAILLLAGLPAAHASGASGDLYFGYSRLGANTFNAGTGGQNGWEAAGHLHLAPFFGAEVDVSHYGLGRASDVPGTTTVMAGPRVTVGAAGVHVFAHGLVGWEHSATSSTATSASGAASFSSNGFAIGAGGGVDFQLAPFFAWRVNADYIDSPDQSPGSGSHDRFGTGLVFRF